jgi:glutathione peroxidase
MIARFALPTLSALALLAGLARPAAAAGSAYDYQFTTIDGKPMPMSQYKGKTVLVVNTASQCGFTPQYKGLEALSQSYKDKGLIVVGVPSNDFGGQEPGSNSDIKKFCEANYDVDFPLAEKVEVTGSSAHPFYKWAAGEKGEPKWNFHKYLIGPDGKLIAAFPSRVAPESAEMHAAIDANLPK